LGLFVLKAEEVSEIMSEERERSENLSKHATSEKNVQELEEVVRELNELISDLTTIQPKRNKPLK